MKTSIHPATTTAEYIATFKRQMKRVGLSYDWDRELIVSDRFEIPVQVNGKLRGKIDIVGAIPREQVARDAIKEWLQGKEPRKIVYVEKKLINFVV